MLGKIEGKRRRGREGGSRRLFSEHIVSLVFLEVRCLSVAYLKPICLTTFEMLAFSLPLYSFTVMCLDMNISFF